MQTEDNTKTAMENRKYKGYRDLKVFQLAYKSAMAIFEITKSFPRGREIPSRRSNKTLVKKYPCEHSRIVEEKVVSKNVYK